MPQYYEIKWGEAACQGTAYTDLFYLVEEQRSLMQYQYINALRSICAICPIWQQCLTYAMEYENYGVWGGLTSVERVAFKDKRRYPNQRARALRNLAQYGIRLEDIMECVEK